MDEEKSEKQRVVGSEMLTPDEQQAIDLSGELATFISQRVIGFGETRNADINEVVSKIHDIQRMIMGQAAARAYPEKYRLLGLTIAQVKHEQIL